MITYSCVVCSGLKVIHIVQKTKNTQCNEIVLYNSRLVWTALKLPFLIIVFPRSNSLANKYHYTVTFDGIAPGPEGTEHLGCCSQVAVFERISSSVPTDESGIGQPYNLVQPLNIFTKPVGAGIIFLINIYYSSNFNFFHAEDNFHGWKAVELQLDLSILGFHRVFILRALD